MTSISLLLISIFHLFQKNLLLFVETLCDGSFKICVRSSQHLIHVGVHICWFLILIQVMICCYDTWFPFSIASWTFWILWDSGSFLILFFSKTLAKSPCWDVAQGLSGSACLPFLWALPKTPPENWNADSHCFIVDRLAGSSAPPQTCWQLPLETGEPTILSHCIWVGGVSSALS